MTQATLKINPPITTAPTTAESEVIYKVLRRNSTVVDFEPSKISVAMTKAFIACEGDAGAESSKIRDLVQKLTAQVIHTLKRRLPNGGLLHIEHIQDQVELALMRARRTRSSPSLYPLPRRKSKRTCCCQIGQRTNNAADKCAVGRRHISTASIFQTFCFCT